jgi:hypothetical protein
MGDEKYARGVVRLLTPGERLLAVAEAQIADGIVPPEPPDARRSDGELFGGVIGKLFTVFRIVFWPVARLSAAYDWLSDLVLYGVAGRGAPGSFASRMHFARQQQTGSGTVLAVTDQRLLLCVTGTNAVRSWRNLFPGWFWKDQNDPMIAGIEVAWSAPREVVARARVRWHRLNPKRLRIDFTDGSWLAFTVPLAKSGHGLRAIAAALADARRTVAVGGGRVG